MSTVEADVAAAGVPASERDTAAGHLEVTTARLARVGDVEVRRLLPLRHRRSVGPWCFVDHYGPSSVDGVAGMAVPPHPHIGIATVTWLIAGNVLHRDSLGSEQMIRPGQLNLMTAGHGIAHSEESPHEHDPWLHGVQLWLALPGADRDRAPGFEHHPQLPTMGFGGLRATVFAGVLAGTASPARVFSPMVGAELAADGGGRGAIPLDPGHEHVVFLADGSAAVRDPAGSDGALLAVGSLLYLASGRDSVTVEAGVGSRLLLLGGEPLGERLLMWWNFVGRTPQDIVTAAADWREGGRFGTVTGYRGEPLQAPPLDTVRLTRHG